MNFTYAYLHSCESIFANPLCLLFIVLNFVFYHCVWSVLGTKTLHFVWNKNTNKKTNNIHLAWECFSSILFGTKTLIKKQTTFDKHKKQIELQLFYFLFEQKHKRIVLKTV